MGAKYTIWEMETPEWDGMQPGDEKGTKRDAQCNNGCYGDVTAISADLVVPPTLDSSVMDRTHLDYNTSHSVRFS